MISTYKSSAYLRLRLSGVHGSAFGSKETLVTGCISVLRSYFICIFFGEPETESQPFCKPFARSTIPAKSIIVRKITSTLFLRTEFVGIIKLVFWLYKRAVNDEYL